MAVMLVLAVEALLAQTYRAGVDLVSFNVTVHDRRGALVTDLSEADFEVYEDGTRQSLRYFIAGDHGEAEAPDLHVGLLIDTSGSMEQDIVLARGAAIKFLNTLPEADTITLVDFDTEVRVARYGQADFPRLVERIRSRKTGGWTALYDALGVYLDGAFDQKGRKVLVMYTDGGDTRSTMSINDALTFLRASDVTVYAVGLLENQPSSARFEQRMRLQQLVEVTGGQAFFPGSARDLDGVFEKIREEVTSQYTLGYHSSNEANDGAWRKVDIRLAREDARDFRLRSRKGYFGPYRPLQQ
jgi:Ca-activated chloride channel homolog